MPIGVLSSYIDSMKRINLLNDVHDFIYLLKLAGSPLHLIIYTGIDVNIGKVSMTM